MKHIPQNHPTKVLKELQYFNINFQKLWLRADWVGGWVLILCYFWHAAHVHTWTEQQPSAVSGKSSATAIWILVVEQWPENTEVVHLGDMCGALTSSHRHHAPWMKRGAWYICFQNLPDLVHRPQPER